MLEFLVGAAVVLLGVLIGSALSTDTHRKAQYIGKPTPSSVRHEYNGHLLEAGKDRWSCLRCHQQFKNYADAEFQCAGTPGGI